jgi:hypothetical protein
MPPQDRKRSKGLLVALTTMTLACAVNLWRISRTVAIIFSLLLMLAWVVNLTVLSPTRELPRDKVPKRPLGL